MKRGGPLKRTKALSRATPLERGSAMKRTTPLRAGRQRQQTAATRAGSGVDAWRRAAWERAPVRAGRKVCPVSGQRLSYGRDDVHHPVERQELRKRGLDEFDPRNGIFVTTRVHEQHTLAVRRIPLDVLPPCVFEYAAELGPWAVALLERYHGRRV